MRPTPKFDPPARYRTGMRCALLPQSGGRFLVRPHSSLSLNPGNGTHVDGEYFGRAPFRVARSGEGDVVFVNAATAADVVDTTGITWRTTPWAGYMIRQIQIHYDSDTTDPPDYYYDDHAQWSLPAVGDLALPVEWPFAQNDGVITGDGRNSAPAFEDSANIYYQLAPDTVPVTDSMIRSLLGIMDAFVQIEVLPTPLAFYYGEATTGLPLDGGGAHGVWYYEMSEAIGTRYIRT